MNRPIYLMKKSILKIPKNIPKTIMPFIIISMNWHIAVGTLHKWMKTEVFYTLTKQLNPEFYNADFS